MEKLTLALVTTIFVACVNPHPVLAIASSEEIQREIITNVAIPCVRTGWDNASSEARENIMKTASGSTEKEVMALLVMLMVSNIDMAAATASVRNTSFSQRETVYFTLLSKLIQTGKCSM